MTQIRSMITTLHTLSLASITHHTNSPRVRLRRPPRARPPLPPRYCVAHRARRICTSPLARPSSQHAARPSPATRPPTRLPPRARPSVLGHRPPPRRRAHRSCASPLAHPSSRRAARPSPATRRPACLPPRARRPSRARPQLTRLPLLGHHPPPGAPPAASVAAAHPAAAARPPPAARRAAGHKRDARGRCQSRETIAVLRRPSS